MRGLAKIVLVAGGFGLLPGAAAAITLLQVDDFQDGTTRGWRTGGANPNPPVQVPDGGPGGPGDGFLLLRANGSSGSGGNLVAFNAQQWTGDYLAAGVTGVAAELRNLGETPLALRLLFEGPGGGLLSAEAVSVLVGEPWRRVVFPVVPASLAGGSDPLRTLADVTKLRLVHAPTPEGAEAVLGALGVDDLTALGPGAAVPEPGGVLLFAIGLGLARAARRRRA